MNTYTTNKKVPGRKGAIARLIILGLVALIGVLASFLTLPEYIARRGFGLALLEAFGGCGIIFLAGAFFWGMIKWIGFIAPKSFRIANKLWRGWIPLTFLGVYIKACLWLIIAIAPCSAYTLLLSPLTMMTAHFAENAIDIFSAFGLFLGGAAAVIVMGFVDICKLRQVSAVERAKQIWAARKVAA